MTVAFTWSIDRLLVVLEVIEQAKMQRKRERDGCLLYWHTMTNKIDGLQMSSRIKELLRRAVQSIGYCVGRLY